MDNQQLKETSLKPCFFGVVVVAPLSLGNFLVVSAELRYVSLSSLSLTSQQVVPWDWDQIKHTYFSLLLC